MREPYYHTAIEKLRKSNRELERLTVRSRAIPPGKRNDIDAKTEDLRLTRSFVARMVAGLEDSGDEDAAKLCGKIRESISEFEREIGRISEKIRVRSGCG